MRTGGTSESVGGGRRRGLEHALRDLVPTTLAAGAVAVAVAVAVGGSTSGLPAPFAPGLRGDWVTSTPATPQPLGGRMGVRLGPKATRTPAPPGLGEHLVATSPGATGRVMPGAVDAVLFGPIFLSQATDGTAAAGQPAAEATAVREVVGPALADSPNDQALIADVVVVAAPSELQEARRSQRPHRLKSPKGEPKAGAGAEPLTAVAASLSPSTLVPGTSPEPAPGPAGEAAGDDGNKGNGKVRGNGNGNGQGSDNHKAGNGQARHSG